MSSLCLWYFQTLVPTSIHFFSTLSVDLEEISLLPVHGALHLPILSADQFLPSLSLELAHLRLSEHGVFLVRLQYLFKLVLVSHVLVSLGDFWGNFRRLVKEAELVGDCRLFILPIRLE